MTFDSAITVDGFKDWVEALLLRGTSGGASTSSNDPPGITCGSQCDPCIPHCNGCQCTCLTPLVIRLCIFNLDYPSMVHLFSGTLSGVVGCDGQIGSTLLEDRCGECAGDGSTCPQLQSWVPLDKCPRTVGGPSTIKLSNAVQVVPWTAVQQRCVIVAVAVLFGVVL